MFQLKKSLFAAYNGFADKRIKNLSKGSTFIVDDRTQGDYAADKTLFLWFCSVCVDVIAEDEVSVRLAGGVPAGPSVNAWIKANDGALNSTPTKVLTFSVKKGSEVYTVVSRQGLRGHRSARQDVLGHKLQVRLPANCAFAKEAGQ